MKRVLTSENSASEEETDGLTGEWNDWFVRGEVQVPTNPILRGSSPYWQDTSSDSQQSSEGCRLVPVSMRARQNGIISVRYMGVLDKMVRQADGCLCLVSDSRQLYATITTHKQYMKKYINPILEEPLLSLVGESPPHRLSDQQCVIHVPITARTGWWQV